MTYDEANALAIAHKELEGRGHETKVNSTFGDNHFASCRCGWTAEDDDA